MSTVRGWIVCLAAASFFAYELIQLHMLNAISPMLMQDLGLSATDFSTLCSTYLLADVLFLIPAGMILDRMSVRRVILFALAICIIGTFGFASSTSLWQACCFHFLSGIGNAFCFLSCMILANSWFEGRSSFIMSIMITIGLLGGVLAQVPVALLTEHFGWQGTLILDGVIGCVIWIGNFLFVRERGGYPVRNHTSWRVLFQQLRMALGNGQVWRCGLYTGCLNLPLMLISAMMGNLYLTQVMHFDLREASWIASMISLGTILGSPLYGFVSDYMQRKKTWMSLGAFLSLVVFALILWVQTTNVWIEAGLFFSLGFVSASQVLGYPMIVESSPETLKGTCMGVAALLIMGLAFILQPITGMLMDWHRAGDGLYNFTYAMMIFPVAFFVALVMVYFIREREVRTQEA